MANPISIPDTIAKMDNVSRIELEYTGIKEYEWKFRVPPTSTIRSNLLIGPSKEYDFKNLRFNTGVLGKLDHYWQFKINADLTLYINLCVKYRPDIGFSLDNTAIHFIESNSGSKGYGLDLQQVKRSKENDDYIWTGMSNFYANYWTDSIDCLKIVFKFQCEPAASCINPSWPNHSNVARKGLNASSFYLDEFLSDVTLECGAETFPAHRFILACRSSVFKCMFQTDMKESKNGIVSISDIDPMVLKKMLEFVYTDDLKMGDMDHQLYVELFKAAHKYEIEDLKLKCRNKILVETSVENALDFYILGDIYNEEAFRDTALELIKRNKVKAFQDPKTYREFTNRYPQLAFDLLSS